MNRPVPPLSTMASALCLVLAACFPFADDAGEGDAGDAVGDAGDPGDARSCEGGGFGCHDGSVYWIDGCGEPLWLQQECIDVLCADGACQPASCGDGLRNGWETDVDCGGSACLPCAQGQVCLLPEDCMSRVCDAMRCLAPTCEDDVHNGSETDLDCGGDCPACGAGVGCVGDGDCASLACDDGVCAASTCSDSQLNGTETDVDCGGGCAGCPGGATCAADADCESEQCSGTVCAPFSCPEGMVRIGDRPACVDRYEAVLFADASCTGLRFGEAGDDYPAGFPDRVESEQCSGVCQGSAVTAATAPLVACSLPGVRPSAHLTWFQAKRACEEAGKKLCRWPSHWYPACQGEPPAALPYGDDFVPGLCNDGYSGEGATVAAGGYADCHGRGFAAPLFDMAGNVWEWTGTCTAEGLCRGAGGSFAEGGADFSSCGLGHLTMRADYAGDGVGVRCCWEP